MNAIFIHRLYMLCYTSAILGLVFVVHCTSDFLSSILLVAVSGLFR